MADKSHPADTVEPERPLAGAGEAAAGDETSYFQPALVVRSAGELHGRNLALRPGPRCSGASRAASCAWSAPLRVRRLELVGPAAGDFQVDGADRQGRSLARGESCTIAVAFRLGMDPEPVWRAPVVPAVA
jgi:hypothetical protein